jgi:hypothetical protein
VATGRALAVALACSGARTDRPAVTSNGGQSEASPSGKEMAKKGNSLVRVVNAIPAGHDIAVSGDDNPVVGGIAYKSVTPYAAIRDNPVTFWLRAAGSDSTPADNHETMADGYRHTIVALPGGRGELRMRIPRDEVVTDAGKTRKPMLMRAMRSEAGTAYTFVLAGLGTGGIDAITLDDTVAGTELRKTSRSRSGSSPTGSSRSSSGGLSGAAR